LAPALLLSPTDVVLFSSFLALYYFITVLLNITEITNSKCSVFATSAFCTYFSLQILQFVLVGVQKLFCLWHRRIDNGYAADYGTSRKLQKYDVIDTVAELPQNHSNYSFNTTTACYSGRFTM